MYKLAKVKIVVHKGNYNLENVDVFWKDTTDTLFHKGNYDGGCHIAKDTISFGTNIYSLVHCMRLIHAPSRTEGDRGWIHWLTVTSTLF